MNQDFKILFCTPALAVRKNDKLYSKVLKKLIKSQNIIMIFNCLHTKKGLYLIVKGDYSLFDSFLNNFFEISQMKQNDYIPFCDIIKC